MHTDTWVLPKEQFSARLQGRCLCGAVHWSYDAPFSAMLHCHCSLCRKHHGTLFATTVVGPVRWIEAYGWRRLDPVELAAITKVSTRFGELMGLKGLPTTYDGYLALLVDYERHHFAHTPAATRLAEASIRIARDLAPVPLRPLVRCVTIAGTGYAGMVGQQREAAWNVDWPRGEPLENYKRTMNWEAQWSKEES